ncbi:hypothetical protein CNY89_21940, partial [Amaricoccus sp. HAR-UPW-R2A-40]
MAAMSFGSSGRSVKATVSRAEENQTGRRLLPPRPTLGRPQIDFIGIDNYMPLSDWRDGFEHLDAAEGWPAI